jgi:hypothetical protein
MNSNLRTAALIAAGIVSAGSTVFAEEAKTNPVETALSATTISGYVSTSALFDLGNDEGGTRLPGRTYDNASRIDQFNLDVVKLTIERPLEEADWSAAYKVDLLFGPDANVQGNNSLNANTSDFAIKQAYVALQTPIGNGLIAKMGVFDTIIGYEVFESYVNPNYSRSYAYFIEPFQHTGLLLSYQFTDWLTANAGVADAWNTRINAPGAEPLSTPKDYGVQTYMGSVAITAPKDSGFLEGASLYGGVVYGLGSADLNDGDPRTSLYGGLTIPTPLEALAVGLAYDYRMTERARVGASNADEYATTMAAYLAIKLSEQMKLNLRGEYATGSAGTWGAKPVAGPDKEEFFGLTASLDYNLWANVLTRLEFRWDQDMGDGTPAFGGATPGEEEENAYIIGLNVIYKF